MYQYALVKMLHNTITGKWHPIYYYDSPFPGPIEKQPVIRYKSKGHHTQGFEKRDNAVELAKDLIKKLEEQHDMIFVEIQENDDIAWDGNDIPTDIQLRLLPEKISNGI